MAAAAGRGRTAIRKVTDPCFFVDPVIGRCVEDGVAGAPERPRGGAERGHRQRCSDGRRCDELDHAHGVGRRPRRLEQRACAGSARRRTGYELVGTGRDRDRWRQRATMPRRRSRRTEPTPTSSTTRSRRRSVTTRPRRASLVGVVKHADVASGGLGALEHAQSRRDGRSARLEPERPHGRIPRRLRLRGRDEDVRRGRVERRAQRGRLPGDRRLADVAAHAGHERRCPETGSAAGLRPATFGNTDIFGWSQLDPTP